MTAVGATTTWQVDTARTTAAFVVGNLGVRRVRGTVPVLRGTIAVDGDGRVTGLHAVVDATGVGTGNAQRDRDLRGPRLLGVGQAPTWTFVSTGVEQDGDGWRVPGVLTVRRACPVVLAVGPAEPLPDGGVRVRATTTLDRRAAGVRAPRVLIGREVTVELDAVLRPQRSASAGGGRPAQRRTEPMRAEPWPSGPVGV